MKSKLRLSTVCLAIVVIAAMLLFGITEPRVVKAAPGCKTEDARGDYGFQFFGTVQPGIPTPATFAETGRMTVDKNGNLSGLGQYSLGGFFVSHTFTGKVNVKADCTAIADIKDTFNSAGTLFDAQAFWVIVKPGQDILMTSLAQTGAVNGRMTGMRGND